jgi:hypothetical protein
MPSGFQQDPNQLQPAFFRVVMDMTNQYNYWTNTNHPEATGSVQPYTWDNFTGNDLPTTAVAGVTLARGNLRFQRIIEELCKYSDAQILDLEALSGTDPVTGNNLANHLAFTVRYDRFGIDDENVEAHSPLLAMEQKYLRSITNGSTSSPYDNESINNTYEAVQEAIMRALIEHTTRSVRVFVPVEGSDPLVGEGTQQQVTINDVTHGQDENNYSTLRGTITVNGPLDGTTLITTDDDAA